MKLTEPVALPPNAVRLLSTTSSQPLAFSATTQDNGRVIRIELTQPAQFDRVTLIIDYAAAGLDGLELDGEVDNPDNPTLPSGDGTRGGQAVFRFNVMPGDLDRDGDVDLFDLARLLTNFQTAFPVTPTDGDLNSDGRVDLPDLAVMLTSYGVALPPLGPTRPSVASTTPSVALFDDLSAIVVRFSEPMTSQLNSRAVFAINETGVLHAASTVAVTADRREATFGFATAIPQCQDLRVYIGNALTSATGQFLTPTAPVDLSGFVAPPTPIVNSFPVRTINPTVALSGVATGAVTLEVSGPTGVVSFAANAADQFSGNVTIGQNRANLLFLTPISACGVRGAPRTINITHDVQPPTLFVDFPDTQTPVAAASTDIAGRVADLLSGFVGLTVTVNGQPAQVFEGIGTNGSFFLPAFPLNVGENPVTVVGRDALGNQATRNVVITREEIPADAPRMEIISGNAQSAPMHGLLAEPIVVRVTRSTGAPIAGKVVTFDVTRSDGRLYAAPPIGDEAGELMVQVQTDAAGLARAYWRVGADAGEGNNRVCALSRDIAGTVFFCASTLPGAAAQINIGTGNNQRAETGSPAPEPLRAWVSDACNGIVGVPVTFTVTAGNGRIVAPGGQLVSTLTVPTIGTGHAAVEFVLGDEPGNNAVEANFVGNAGNPATFVVFGLRRDETRPTTFSGLILDNSSNPLGGAGVRLFVNRSPVAETISDDQGQFRFEDVPSSGHADVFIDAASIDLVAGQPLPADTRYPDMHYETIVVPNSDNSLSMPVLLPPLKIVNDRVYRWNQPTDLALTCDGMAGLKMIVKVGTTIVLPPGPGRPSGAIVGPNHPPDGTAERPGEVTLAINQVHHDEIPMPMPDGASPPFAWTFQPGGSHFDIPVAIEYPNMSALPAGALSNFLSFNHETNRFEIIATGTVAADGSVIRSDAGVGITVSGWGGNCPPYPVNGDAGRCPPCQTRVAGQCVPVQCGPCQRCVGGNCVSIPGGCDDGDPCTIDDQCVDGQCVGTPVVCADCEECVDGHCVRVNGPGCPECEQGCGQCEECDDGWCRGTTGGQCDDQCDVTEGDTCVNGICRGEFIGCDTIFALLGVDIEIIGPAVVAVGETAQYTITGSPFLLFTFWLPGTCDDSRATCELDSSNPLIMQVTGNASGEITIGAIFYLPRICGRFSCSQAVFRGVRVVECPEEPCEHVPSGPDPRFILSLGGQSAVPTPDGGYFFRNISSPDNFGPDGPGSPRDQLSDDFLRVTGTASIDGVTYYAFSEPFQIRQGQTQIIDDLTITTNPPPLPEFIRFGPHVPALNTLGATAQMSVSATLADGQVVDVTSRTTWTTYRTSNPAVATVNRDGLVTAVGRGAAFITAVNDGATAVTRIDVVPGDPLTTVVGLVQLEDESPVDDATVTLGNGGGLTNSTADGSFTLTQVPSTLGFFSIAASKAIDNQVYSGTVFGIPPTPGGITDAGIITLSPRGVDSDGDCLPDLLEQSMPGYLANDSDSDNDNVPDGQEDADGDGLTNCQEAIAGLNPLSRDSDDDLLEDGDELEFGTNPLEPDTDEDGYLDGEEVEYNADPLQLSSTPFTSGGIGEALHTRVVVANGGMPGSIARDVQTGLTYVHNLIAAGASSGDTTNRWIQVLNRAIEGAFNGDALQTRIMLWNRALEGAFNRDALQRQLHVENQANPDPANSRPESASPRVSTENQAP